MYHKKLAEFIMGTLGLGNEDKDNLWPIMEVYQTFKELAKEFPDIFKGIYFSEKGGKIYSKNLEELFFQIGTSKLLEVKNPEYGTYLVDTTSKASILTYLKAHLTTPEYKKAEKLAKRFRELINTSHVSASTG